MRRGLTIATLIAAAVAAPAALAQSVPTLPDDRLFKPPPDDPAVGILREIFGNLVDFVSGSATAADLASNNTVIGAGFAVFCSAVLTLGLLFVAYTSFIGIVNTAHDGEFLGKKMSSAWIPIRTAAGSALLLPLAGGFCLLQIIVMWMAVQGVGIADTAWNAMLDRVEQTGMVNHPNIHDSRPLIANIFRYEVCMAAMNKSFAESGRSERVELERRPNKITVWVPTEDFKGNIAGTTPLAWLGFGRKRVTYDTHSYAWTSSKGYIGNDVCGRLDWEESAMSEAGNSRYINLSGVYAAHGAMVDDIIRDVRPIAQTIVEGNKPVELPISAMAYRYEQQLRQLSLAAVNQVGNSPRDAFIKTARLGGFAGAGTYYNHIIAVQDAVQLAVNSFPTSVSLDIDKKETSAALVGYQDSMAVAEEYLLHRSTAAQDQFESTNTLGNMAQACKTATTWEALRKCLSMPALMGLSTITGQLAGSNTSHVAQVKSIGDTIVNTAWGIVGLQFAARFVAGSAEISVLGTDAGRGLSSALESVGFIVSFLVMAMLAAGVMMSFYIPMIPFIAWITGMIKWVVSVVEAMIAAPIWGAAHIHPDGDDAVGRAGPGYFIILSMIMRPILMIFGLICSIAVANPIAHLVNAGFMYAVTGAMGDSLNGLGALVAYSVIYVIIMTTVLHSVFSLINWIPDMVMRWMGSAVGMHGVADREDAESQQVFAMASRESKHGMAGGGGHKGGGQQKATKPPSDGGPTTNPSDHNTTGKGGR